MVDAYCSNTVRVDGPSLQYVKNDFKSKDCPQVHMVVDTANISHDAIARQ